MAAPAITIAAANFAAAQVANLCPGQFTGRVRIGTRDVGDASFSATSTNPTGLTASVSMNGTLWNGTDFTGPLDPDGYKLSVQSDIPGCDPDDSTLVSWDLLAQTVSTSSGFGDQDFTQFPTVSGATVSPQGTTVVEFVEPNPWILDVSVTNLGCPTSDMYQVQVDGRSFTNGFAWTYSNDSQLTTDGLGHQVRYSDIPLITGAPNATLDTYHVYVTAYFTGAQQSYIQQDFYLGPSDVDANGHMHVDITVSSDCANNACNDTKMIGNITLNGISAADAFSDSFVCIEAGCYTGNGVFTMPGDYDLVTVPPGRYHPSAISYFYPDGLQTYLVWPLSSSRDVDGFDPFPFEDLACHEVGVFDFLADAAFIEGDVSFSCQAAYGSNLINRHIMGATSFYEGTNPDGSFIGSFLGQGGAFLDPSIGHYRLILTSGTWNVGGHSMVLSVNPPSGDPDYPDYVNQSMTLYDYRSLAPAGQVNDPRAIHLTAGQNFTRNLAYEMGKLTVNFTITAPTPPERELRNPRLSPIDPGTFNDPNSSFNPIYEIYANGSGTSDVTQNGKVTMYLPKGFYRFLPQVVRQIDGSDTALPELDVTIGGCVVVGCDVSCPTAQWMPLPDSCGGETGSVSGTAHDSDGWNHIAYRVNHPTPGQNDLTGYTAFTLVPTGGPSNEVSFSAPLSLNVGANTVELEAVDAIGNRYYEQRTVYRTAGLPPTLNWTSPPDGYVTSQPTVQVQGSVVPGVKADFVKLNGTSVALSTIPGTPDPNDRSFDETYVLSPGPNTITLRACDVCGLCVEETRTVTMSTNRPPSCDAGGVYNVTAGGQVTLDGTGSQDPDGDTLQYSWTTDCPGGSLSAPFSATPILGVGAPPACACTVHLVVNDPAGAIAECASEVTLSCDDDDSCTVDTCDADQGCVYTPAEHCADPRTQGYWKRLCAGPHPSGETITASDVDCVNDTCAFADVQTVAQLCDRLDPSPPSDKCEQAEAQFMSLMLNLCHDRVVLSDAIESSCTPHATVGPSKLEADALLCSPARSQSTCTAAQCESEEINSGSALGTNSLRLARESGGIRLDWDPPTGSELAPPRAYQVWKATDPDGVFVKIAEAAELHYVDPSAGESLLYRIKYVW